MELATKEDYDVLAGQLDEIRGLMSVLTESVMAPDVVYVSDIAKVERLSVSGIKKEPWLLPNFGEGEYPGRARWSFKTYREWRQIPVRTRHSMWLTRLENRRHA